MKKKLIIIQTHRIDLYVCIDCFSGQSLRGRSSSVTQNKNPKIKVSLVRPESLSLELYDEESGRKESNSGISAPRHHAPVLPDEITRELEILSQVDKERSNRIAKLEKWRKGVEEVLPECEGDEVEDAASKIKSIVLPESTESSVEGAFNLLILYISGFTN